MKPIDRSFLPASLRDLLGKLDTLNATRREQGFEFTSTNVREGLEQMTRNFVTETVSIAYIHDTHVPGEFAVPVRVYHPSPEEALPVLIFAHGGGHMAGSVSVYDLIARKLTTAGQRVLVSVDYRLAPECPYPAALNDLEQVICGVYPMLERLEVAHERRLAVAGDSGGGAITASAVHRLAEVADVTIESQLLIYPSLDYTLSCASIDVNGCGFLLESDRIRWLFDQYFQHQEDRRACSPLFMPLPPGMPRTLVVTAGFDPLRDEGQAYVTKLRAAGIEAERLHFETLIHAFLNLEDLVPEHCQECYEAIGRFLQSARGSSSDGD